MMAPHRITVKGCDAHTTIIIPLTPAELALVGLIADAITRTSSYRCMPTMSVGPAEPDDDDGSAGVVFRETDNV